MKPLLLALLLCTCGLVVLAGDPVPAKPAEAVGIPPVPPAEDAWQFTFSLNGWLAGGEGTLGIKGFTTPVDVSFEDILKNLDMAAMFTLEARKGRWGGWIDFAYADVSVGGNPSGPLFDSVGLSMKEALVEAAVFYRVLEGERGFLDLYAGARYNYVGGEIELNVSDAGLREVSENLSQQLVDQMLAAVKAKAEPAVSAAASRTADKLATEARSKLAETVSQKASNASQKASAALSQKAFELEGKINDLRKIAAAHPVLSEKLRNSTALKEALKNVASAQLESKRIELENTQLELENSKRLELEQKVADATALTSELQAAASRAKSKAEKALTKAEKRLAEEIENALARNIPDAISGSQEWVDPFVGMRARYNFTDRLYAVAKADIGGFGVGADLVWQAYGAFGYELTKSGKTTLEVGYRYMSIDYASSDFIYDVNLSGAMVSLGFTF